MSHLTTETLARLVDEAPTALEAAHLDACEPCRAEFDALREDIRALATLPDMTPAPDAWDALSLRLAEEGIMRSGRATPFRFRPLLQAAAAAILFVAGLAVGRSLGSATTSVALRDADRVPAPTQAVTPPQPVSGENAVVPAVEVTREPAVEVAPPPPPAASSNLSLAASAGPARAAPPRTVDEAATLLRQTEELYLGALTRYAELATQADAGDPVARLAALQSIVMTTQAALTQTPTDPVINGYHLTALAQRNATLRQVAAATSDRWY